ncbi:hypothetical protein [Eubacterium oxidoreducens]|uniref:Uncharacterized protein n=1 Tax=Eubacterium oxidoreducens TaxID=1732 RepID=A0A1G5ZZV8_EUBOX|nr:hypothetical protein [Eubacterium oxidoreducens]SDB01697.1 hypothetical protein SAMN02910417_00044 [Eubacterium oxidoreducens]
MKNTKKMQCLLLAGVIASAGAMMAGCSSSSSNVSITSTEIVGEVTAVDGDEITVTVGSLSSGMGAGQGGEAPSGEVPEDSKDSSEEQSSEDKSSESSGSTEDSSSTDSSTDETSSTDSSKTAKTMSDTKEEASEETESDKSTSTSESEGGQEPQGEAPEGGEGAAGSQTLIESDTSMTFTISDESVLEDDASMDDITEGTVVDITIDGSGNIESVTILTDVQVSSSSSNQEQGESTSSTDVSYSGVTEYTSDTQVSDESYTSTGTDEEAIWVSEGANVSLSNITVDRTSSDSTGGDNSSFYGVGAAILNTQGNLFLSNASITSDSAGGAGVFSYDSGVTYVADSTITTQQDTSGGIHVAGGAALYAWDLSVETNGESAAAIRSDRGGGTMVVDGGTYTSNGTGSPAVYCTADITINDAKLTATGSEAVCIEGLNSLRLFDTTLTGNMPDDEQNDNTWTVILYQSMSGDSEVGNSDFEMVGGTINSENGGLFYTTNTESTILLSDVDINYSDDNDFFLQVTGNTNERGWGTEGENGANCTFTADDQQMQGKIIYDSISTLDFYMTNGSSLTGCFVDDETYAGDGGDGYCNVYISEDSTWTVTADSEVDDLYNAGTITDEDGNTVSIVGEDGTVYVEGDSSYTITVGSYSTDDKTSNAQEVPSYSDYEVDKPSELE